MNGKDMILLLLLGHQANGAFLILAPVSWGLTHSDGYKDLLTALEQWNGEKCFNFPSLVAIQWTGNSAGRHQWQNNSIKPYNIQTSQSSCKLVSRTMWSSGSHSLWKTHGMWLKLVKGMWHGVNPKYSIRWVNLFLQHVQVLQNVINDMIFIFLEEKLPYYHTPSCIRMKERNKKSDMNAILLSTVL